MIWIRTVILDQARGNNWDYPRIRRYKIVKQAMHVMNIGNVISYEFDIS